MHLNEMNDLEFSFLKYLKIEIQKGGDVWLGMVAEK